MKIYPSSVTVFDRFQFVVIAVAKRSNRALLDGPREKSRLTLEPGRE